MNPRVPCGLTGVGSLPFVDVEEALALAASFDVPFLPELPAFDPSEFMIPAALRGFDAGEPDLALVDRFLQVLPRPRLVKVQMAGPTTVLAFAPGIARTVVIDWLSRRARATLERLRAAGHTTLFMLDEPALATHAPDGLTELIEVIRAEGAQVGVHCCGNTDWARLVSFELDFVSFDARLSLDALLADARAFEAYVERGGALAIGVVPTTPGPAFELSRLAPLKHVLSRSLLTPACGLGLHSPERAREIVTELRVAQARVRSGLAEALGDR